MSLSKIRSAERSLTKTDDANEELAMMLAPRLNWVEQISPAPMAINAMGQLALLSTKSIDFDLTTPEKGYVHLRYTSFKPNLMQVCNSGHNAFQRAHVNMGAIQQATNRLPIDMQKAVQILVTGNNIQMEKFLPPTMDSIRSIAVDCLGYAEDVENKFISTQEMIAELLEVCFATQGATEKERDKLALLKIQSEESKKMYQERKKMQEQEKERIANDLEKRTKEYGDALDQMPTGWTLVGMSVVESLTGAISDGIKVASNAFSAKMNPAGTMMSAVNNQTAGAGQSNGSGNVGGTGRQLRHADLDLLRIFDTMPTLIVGLTEKMEVIDKETNKKEKNNDLSIFTNVEIILNREIEMNMSSAPEETKTRVKPVLEELQSTLPKLRCSWPDLTVDHARKELSDLLDKMVPFGAEYKAASGNKALTSQTPHASTAANAEASSGGESATQVAVKNAQFKVTQANEMLQHTEKKYNEANEELLASNAKLNEVLQELAKIDTNTMTTNEILKILKRGLLILGELKEKWSALTVFFSDMVTLIEVSMNKPLELFLQYAQSAKEVKESGAPMDKLMLDIIYKTAREAVAYGYVVNRMSSGYHDISTKYLMGPVSTLAKMMTLEDAAEVNRLQVELNTQSLDAQDSIMRLHKMERENFKNYMERKMLAINGSFDDITSEIDETEKRQIEQQVRVGMEAVPVQELNVSTNIDDIVADDW